MSVFQEDSTLFQFGMEEEDVVEFEEDSPEELASPHPTSTFLVFQPILDSDLFVADHLTRTLWSVNSASEHPLQAVLDCVSEQTPEDNEMIKSVLREIANIEAQTKRPKILKSDVSSNLSSPSADQSSSPIQLTPNTPISDGNRPPIIAHTPEAYSSPSGRNPKSPSRKGSSPCFDKANGGSLKRKPRKGDIAKKEPLATRRRTRRQHFEETFRVEEVIKIQVVSDGDDEEIDIC